MRITCATFSLLMLKSNFFVFWTSYNYSLKICFQPSLPSASPPICLNLSSPSSALSNCLPSSSNTATVSNTQTNSDPPHVGIKTEHSQQPVVPTNIFEFFRWFFKKCEPKKIFQDIKKISGFFVIGNYYGRSEIYREQSHVKVVIWKIMSERS